VSEASEVVCAIYLTELGTKGVIMNCVTEGIPRHATPSEVARIEEYDNEVQILSPSGQANAVEVYTLNAAPKTDVIMRFLYSYWYLIALIILGIVLAIAL